MEENNFWDAGVESKWTKSITDENPVTNIIIVYF